jgi:uncharacterized protein YkwD
MKKVLVSSISFLVLFIVQSFAVSAVFAQRIASRQFKTELPRVVNSSSRIENTEFQIFDLINRERQKKGLGEMAWDGNLARLARSYSQKMADEDFFSHFDSNGASVVERARSMKIKNWRKIGENLFECEGENNYAPFSVQKWMKSPTHRGNILDPEWTSSGLGVAVTRDGRVYITQVFVKN